MKESFESITILKRLDNYSEINEKIFIKSMFTLDEVSMYHDMGEICVINRLKNDRDYLYNLLSDVDEIDISEISISIRDEKLDQLI